MLLPPHKKAVGFLLCAGLTLWLCAADSVAGTFTAFGPQTYERGTGEPVTVRNTFSVRNPATQYTMRVRNGGLVDGDFEPVSSTVITLNGVQIFAPTNLTRTSRRSRRP